MKRRMVCPTCGKHYRLEDSQIGKKVRCGNCNNAFIATENLESDAAVETQEFDGQSPSETSIVQDQPSLGRLGKYQLQQVVGSGGFGIVYRAVDTELGREVAIKVPRFAADDRNKVRRFLMEAKAAAKLSHPNLVALYECDEVSGSLYIASEFVHGRSLTEYVNDPSIDLDTKVMWARDLIRAVDFAHRQGIIHRDIKPDNVLVNDVELRPQLTDFGLAKLIDEQMSMQTQDGSLLGTPAYMAPEQARGDLNQVGPHSDQYSLSVLLFELLTGERPYQGRPFELIAAISSDTPPPSAHVVNSEIPLELSAIIAKAMSKEPLDRYDSASEFADDLDRWLDGERPLAPIPGKPRRLLLGIQRNWFLVSAICIPIVVVLVSLANTWKRDLPSDEGLHEANAVAVHDVVALEDEEPVVPARDPGTLFVGDASDHYGTLTEALDHAVSGDIIEIRTERPMQIPTNYHRLEGPNDDKHFQLTIRAGDGIEPRLIQTTRGYWLTTVKTDIAFEGLNFINSDESTGYGALLQVTHSRIRFERCTFTLHSSFTATIMFNQALRVASDVPGIAEVAMNDCVWWDKSRRSRPFSLSFANFLSIQLKNCLVVGGHDLLAYSARGNQARRLNIQIDGSTLITEDMLIDLANRENSGDWPKFDVQVQGSIIAASELLHAHQLGSDERREQFKTSFYWNGDNNVYAINNFAHLGPASQPDSSTLIVPSELTEWRQLLETTTDQGSVVHNFDSKSFLLQTAKVDFLPMQDYRSETLMELIGMQVPSRSVGCDLSRLPQLPSFTESE